MKVKKLKPANFDFLAPLASNCTLERLSIELFKMNPQFYNADQEPRSDAFIGLENTILKEFSLKASTYREYNLFSNYFASILSMYKNLEKIEFSNV